MRKYYRYNNLGKIIKARGFLVVEVADYSRVNVRSLQRYIAGDRIPDVRVALRLANCLSVSVYDLYDKPFKEVKLRWSRICISLEDKPYNNVEDFMKARGMTPMMLARRAGIKDRVIYDYVSGKTIPNIMDAITIANVLRVSIYELFDRPFFI